MEAFLKQDKSIISTGPGSALMADSDASDWASDSELRPFEISPDLHGGRLDRALTVLVPEFSRSYLQQLISQGMVRIGNSRTVKASQKVHVGDKGQIELRPTPQSQAFKPEVISFPVIYQDDHLMVVDKPAGLVVHPAPGNWSGTLLNGILALDDQSAFLPRAGIVHRLDKDTSGLMVVARTRQAMDLLVRMIAQRSVKREYMAIALHEWTGATERRVELPIGRDPRNRLKMAIVNLDTHPGKPASTRFRLVDNSHAGCLMHCSLETGRTHQIRVHLSALGHPILGDAVYGGGELGLIGRQAL
jgi:23S rRNA pseudouridine1911/1915/1917 synthase